MKAIKQICLGILLLLIIAMSAVLVMVALNVIPLDYMQTFVSVVYSVPINSVLLVLLGAVMFVMCMVAIFGRGGGSKKKRRRTGRRRRRR